MLHHFLGDRLLKTRPHAHTHTRVEDAGAAEADEGEAHDLRRCPIQTALDAPEALRIFAVQGVCPCATE